VLRCERLTPERPAGPPGVLPLPCLNRINSDRVEQKPEEKQGKSRQKKVAFSLQENVKSLADRYGIERLGFLTLTFADHVLDAREAGRRFDNLRRRVISDRYVEWVRVIERQKSGRVHFHLLVVLAHDIRTGVDFAAFQNGNYGSAGPKLRAEWAFWRNVAPRYGFGRTELLPVKSNAEGIGRYVGKYISKHMEKRIEADKGVRLVSASRGARRVNANFDWKTPGAELWRAKLGIFARSMGAGPDSYNEKFVEWFGPRWAYFLRPVIEGIRLPEYRTGVHFLIDYPTHRTAIEWEYLEPSEVEAMALSDQSESQQTIANAYRFACALRAIHHAKSSRPTEGRGGRAQSPQGPAKTSSPFGRSALCAPALESTCSTTSRRQHLAALER